MRTCDPLAGLTLTKAAVDTMRLDEYIEGIGTCQADDAIQGEKWESLSLAARRRGYRPFQLFVRCCER